jgi:hypothetical protein
MKSICPMLTVNDRASVNFPVGIDIEKDMSDIHNGLMNPRGAILAKPFNGWL